MFDPEAVLRGERQAVARALNAVEGRFNRKLLDALWGPVTAAPADGAPPRGLTLGLTGPPGVGKSTLAGRLIAAWRKRGLSVGVLCIDPSSRKSGGALLGDRLRMRLDTPDDGVFVRSMAARDRLGGLAPAAWEATLVLRAAFDRVLVETVGVGQSETDIARLSDVTAVVVQPASGDVLQFLKAGLMEVFDLLVVNKADLGQVAEKAVSDLKTALRVLDRRDVAALAISAENNLHIDRLLDTVETLAAHDSAAITARRAAHFREHRLAEVIAWHGLRAAGVLGGQLALGARVAALPNTLPPSAIDATLAAWFGE